MVGFPLLQNSNRLGASNCMWRIFRALSFVRVLFFIIRSTNVLLSWTECAPFKLIRESDKKNCYFRLLSWYIVCNREICARFFCFVASFVWVRCKKLCSSLPHCFLFRHSHFADYDYCSRTFWNMNDTER